MTIRFSSAEISHWDKGFMVEVNVKCETLADLQKLIQTVADLE